MTTVSDGNKGFSNIKRSAQANLEDYSFWQSLIKYYKTCIMQESGLSEFLQRRSTCDKYAFVRSRKELLLSNTEGEVKIDNAIRNLAYRAVEKGNALCYGYPVLLIKDEKSKVTRRKLAPLFVYDLALPEQGKPFPNALIPRTEEPFIYGTLLSFFGFKDEQQNSFINSINFEEWLGDPDTVRTYVSSIINELGARMIDIIDPESLKQVEEGNIDGVGFHNVAIVFQTSRSVYNARLLDELNTIEGKWDEASRTACAFLMPGYKTMPAQPTEHIDDTVLSAPLPLNDAQKAALRSSVKEPLTIVTGPPGTGKSQLVTSIVSNAWISGQSVLVASTNNQAVNVACSRAQGIWPGLILRTGSKDYRESLNELIQKLVTERDDIPDIRALKTRFSSVSERINVLLKSMDDATLFEIRMSSIRLGWEKLVNSLGTELIKVFVGNNRRALLKLKSFLSNYREGKGWFRQWRINKLIDRYKLDFIGRIDEVIEVLSLTLEWVYLNSKVMKFDSFNVLWEKLHGLEMEFTEASKDLSAALAKTSFRKGSTSLRMFAQARYRYGHGGGPQDYFSSALKYARAWATTALSAGASIPLKPALFDLVVVDEASQCSIPNIIPLLFRARRAVIIGDPMQLTHITTLTKQAEDSLIRTIGLNKNLLLANALSYRKHSLYRSLEKKVEGIFLLDEHYRSHPDIIEISNRLFYNDSLKILTDPRRYLDIGLPSVRWDNVKGNAIRPDNGSAINMREAEAVVKCVNDIARSTESSFSIGIVTPFSAQSKMISDMLDRSLSLVERQKIKLGIGTAHRFQGDERDIIVFSTVITQGLPDRTISWLEHTPNIFNVAVSRARSSLIVIGDRLYCSTLNGPLSDLAKYVTDLENKEKVSIACRRGELHSEAEKRLYEALVKKGIEVVLKARVQGYEADFVIVTENKIINIECDGRHHTDNAGRLRRQDRARDALIRAIGWDVIRVPAWKCLSDPDSIVDFISNEKEQLGEMQEKRMAGTITLY